MNPETIWTGLGFYYFDVTPDGPVVKKAKEVFRFPMFYSEIPVRVPVNTIASADSPAEPPDYNIWNGDVYFGVHPEALS